MLQTCLFNSCAAWVSEKNSSPDHWPQHSLCR